MRKKILKSKKMLITLASVLFVSCGGSGGGSSAGSTNLPVNKTPTVTPAPSKSKIDMSDPAYQFPTVTNPLDSQKGDMTALKTSLYSDQLASRVYIPKDTREIDGIVDGVDKGKLEGKNVKVAILDADFRDEVRTNAENKKGKIESPRRNQSLTAIYTDVEILNTKVSNIANAVSGTDKASDLEHGEEVLEVVRDLEWAPNSYATTNYPNNKPKNKINVILGSVGRDYQNSKTNEKVIAGIFLTQKTYDEALERFGEQSVKIFNQSIGGEGTYDAEKWKNSKDKKEAPLYFVTTNSYTPMLPYFRDVVNNKGGLFIWSAGNQENIASTLEAGLPYFDQSIEKGWISVVGVKTQKGNRYNVIGTLSHAGADAAYWAISANDSSMKKITSVNGGKINYAEAEGSSYAAPRVTRAAALVYEKYPWMTNDQIRQTLFTTTDKTNTTINPESLKDEKIRRNITLTPDSKYGWGMLNQARALKGPGAFINVSSNPSASKIFNVNIPTGTTSYFDNDIYGDGGLEKLGEGTLHLTGNNSFSGGSTVTGGTLKIHQIHSSPITVGVNGTLVLNPRAIVGYSASSDEVIGSNIIPEKITDNGIKIKNYGTVKFVGATAIIGGDYVGYEGSTTEVGFLSSVKVLGDIKYQPNTTVKILSNNYVPKQGISNTLMEGKTVEGSISNVEVDGMKTANVEIQDGKVVATLSRQNPVEYIGENAEASSKNVAENVEKVFQDLDQKVLSGTATKEELTMGATLLSMTTMGFRSATEMMSGEIYASAQALTFSQAQNINRDLSNRLVGLDNFKNSDKDSGVWFSAIGSGGKLRRDGYASADTKVTGGQFGIDTKFEGTTTLGVAMNYSYARANFNKYAGESKSEMVGVSLYGKQDLPYGFYTSGRLGLSSISSKVERELLTSRGETVTGKIRHHDKMLSAYVEVGKKGWLTPFIGYSQDYLRRGSFNESEASWGVKADSKNYRATNFLVGARAEYVGDKYKLQAYVSQAINTGKRDLAYEGSFTGSNVKQKFYGVRQSKNTTWIGFGGFREITPVFGVYGNVDFRVEDRKWSDSVISTGLQYRF